MSDLAMLQSGPVDPPLSGSADRGPSEAPMLEAGTIVGRFVILSRLGSGGMGVVYLAYDPKLDRKIALKFLHPRRSDQTPRLLREAQALARVAHPNVVAIHDVGTSEGRVWLAMESIEGPTLAEWLGRGPELRPWPEIIDVLRAAGRGVVAAHAAGLVHRDLKPSNFMIGPEGRVRVMDFGLVRRDLSSESDSWSSSSESGSGPDVHTTLTQRGALLGTPAYMAPEQFLDHGVDARTDQFSFCAVAWRALYGERPFVGDSLTELRYAVIHGRRRSPPRGSKVPIWLRDVVARGLSIDPAARWPSMQALLDALESGRRRAIVRKLALAAVALAVIAGGAELGQRWARAREVAEITQACELEGRAIDEVWNDEARDRLELAFASSDSKLAEDSWLAVREAFANQASAWSEARVQLCIETEIDPQRSPELAEQALICLDESRTALGVMADLMRHIDDSDAGAAVPTLTRLQPPSSCLDDRKLAQLSPPPPPEIRARVTALRTRLIAIDTQMHMHQMATVATDLQALLADTQALGLRGLEAEIEERIGHVKVQAGDPNAATAHYERSFFLSAEQGHDAHAIDVSSRLVYLAYSQGEYDDGLRWARVGEVLLARSDDDLDLSDAHLHEALGSLDLGRGALDESLADFRHALAIYERILPAEHLDLAGLLANTCIVQSNQGDFEGAELSCRRALDIYERNLPRLHPHRANMLNTLAALYIDRGEPAQALPYLRESLEISEATLPPDHPDFGYVYVNFGVAYLDAGDPTQALPEFQRTLDLWAKALRPDHPLLAYPLEGKGRCLVALGNPSEGVELLEQALALRTQDSDPKLLALTQYYLARALVLADPSTRARALELARTSVESLRGLELPDEVGEVEAWLAEQS